MKSVRSIAMSRWYRSRKDQSRHESFSGLAVIQCFPGGGQLRFDGPIQLIGTGIVAVVHYRLGTRGHQTLLETPFRGYTGWANPDGSVVYGGERGCEFNYDLSRRPAAGVGGKTLNPTHHEGLLLRGLAMDRAAEECTHEKHKLPIVPTPPRIMLGFDATRLPAYADTAGLRRLAAKRLGCGANNLNKQRISLDRYLPALWEESVLQPGTEGNPTDCYLVPAELVEDARSAAVFEDVGHLLGVPVWNPARSAQNPMPAACWSLNIKQYDRNAISNWGADIVERVEQRMRQMLGEASTAFEQTSLYEGMVDYRKPIVTSDGRTVRDVLGDVRFAKLMRTFLDDPTAALATDADLLAAADDLSQPLILSGVCRPQVVRLQNLPTEEQLHWSPDLLNVKVDFDLGVEHLRHRGGRHGSHAESHDRMALPVGSDAEAAPAVAE